MRWAENFASAQKRRAEIPLKRSQEIRDGAGSESKLRNYESGLIIGIKSRDYESELRIWF